MTPAWVYNGAMLYEQKRQQLLAEFHEIDGGVGLNKQTSNLFRKRTDGGKKRLNVRHFNQVIAVDTTKQTITVEGMTTFEELVRVSLEHGFLPLVVPELKTITIGGAVSGMAIESSSFRYGLVHESVLEVEVLLANGTVVTATPTNEYKDLFFGLPNSYGTLGYILKLIIKARPAKPFVHLRHVRFSNAKKYFENLQATALSGNYEGKKITFLDGTVFNENEMYLTIGTEVMTAPYTSDYTHMKQYYRSLPARDEDYLTIHDYIWRWDTDWFWCSKNVFADKSLVRRVLGRRRLGSRTYTKMMNFEQRHNIVGRLQKLKPTYHPREDVIQDIEVPIDKAEIFLAKFQNQVAISPIWICPTKTPPGSWANPLYPLIPDTLYVNFGFWDSVPARGDPKDAYFNKFVEETVVSLGGMKSLYSSSYYSKSQFDQLYGGQAYAKLKRKYDSKGRFKDLYTKCVKGG